jgi:RNA polymerase sigma-70 factor (ECF subfamily)
VVDAFLAATREGDFEALIELLDPDVVLRADSGALPPPATQEVHGARAVAELATTFSQVARYSRPALVNGTAGLVTITPRGELFSVQAFTITDGRIVEIDILADPERLTRLDVTVLDE